MAIHIRRRQFLFTLGGAAIAWPLAARAQQQAMPAIGFLSATPSRPAIHLVAAVQRGLQEAGYSEGQTVATEFRWADDQYDRLPELANNLVNRQVAAIVALNSPAALAAKRATTTIPIVFISGIDPVTSGLVESLNRPGGNATGVYILTASLEAKRLEILHEVAPGVATIGVLVNPNFSGTERELKDLHDASRILGVELFVLKVASESGVAGAFATLVERNIGALLVASDPFLYGQRDQIIALAVRHAIPVMYGSSEFARAGGVMSYGTNLTDAYRQVGLYAGRILKGAKPAELPVHQSTTVELVLNLKTAKVLGLTFPITLLGRADEVIE
jgi:putative tryptophan/tyrosine transport system substrate-binding protein